MKTLALAVLMLSASAMAAERLAVLPIGGDDPKLAAAIETALVEAARHVDGVTIANVEGGKLRGPRPDVRGDQRVIARAEALAREQSASIVAVAEPQVLGDGAVAYLQVIDAAGKPRGSTTVVLPRGADPAALERVMRGGLVQILTPEKFVGRLELHVDVKGAQVEIDGHKADATSTLPVGTHAVRVTHPAYHDYLRFVELGFDQARVENVALAAFPLTEGEMDDRRKRTGGVTRKLPWYRSWWALGLSGAVLCGATIGIVYGVRAGVHDDHAVKYMGVPTP